jgi:hypothetical protein
LRTILILLIENYPDIEKPNKREAQQKRSPAKREAQ